LAANPEMLVLNGKHAKSMQRWSKRANYADEVKVEALGPMLCSLARF